MLLSFMNYFNDSSQQPHKVDTTVIAILEMRKLGSCIVYS